MLVLNKFQSELCFAASSQRGNIEIQSAGSDVKSLKASLSPGELSCDRDFILIEFLGALN